MTAKTYIDPVTGATLSDDEARREGAKVCMMALAEMIKSAEAFNDDAEKPTSTETAAHYFGSRGQRFMLDIPIEDAEALIACLTNAIRLRREAEAIAKATATRQARAHFMDTDGLLEAA